MNFYYKSQVFVLITCLSLQTSGYGLAGTVIGKWRQDAEALDPEGKYLLSWEVNMDTKSITFDAQVETLGFVGFGISPTGSMTGADIFIAGVNSATGAPYSYDMHGVGNTVPVEDARNDWNLLDAWENSTHTGLRFSRLLNTCDDEDFPITEDTSRVIWSYGPRDNIEYHTNRGTTSFNLIAPPIPDVDLSKFKRWKMTTNSTMSSMDTSYFCTVHKSSNFTRENHIVAFDAVLNNVDAKKHTHHFTLYACGIPAGENGEDIFEPFLYPAYEGHECYSNDNPIPYHLCQNIVYIWAVGGKPTIFPEFLGLPSGLGETYYILEIHYDNPRLEENKTFETGLEIYHTEELRETEVGVFISSHAPDPSLIVPPETSEFVITGHCPEQCTSLGFPPQGISIFNVLLHSHLSGRRMKFRNGHELPWILSDANYDFNFQQNKPLKEFVKVLPGDHLTVECTYDSRWKNGQVVSGGLTSREEMCEAVFYYYPKVEMGFCSGSYPIDQAMKEFGVTNYTIEYTNPGPVYKATILAPPSVAGDFMDLLNEKFNWTPAFINQMRVTRKLGIQNYYCTSGDDYANGITRYPFYDKEYAPEDECLIK